MLEISHEARDPEFGVAVLGQFRLLRGTSTELLETETSPSTGPFLVVEYEKNRPLPAGDYVFHQGSVTERGTFGPASAGRAALGKIDLRQPFIFEVRDRVCAIRAGAFLNPDDPTIQYGGTRFTWELVRDNTKPDTGARG